MIINAIKKEKIEVEVAIQDILLVLKQNILNVNDKDEDEYELNKYFVSDNKIFKQEYESYNDIEYIKYIKFSDDKDMVNKFETFLKLENLFKKDLVK
jgi:TRAP-type mannitol/chloroaromatic compound transport system substrate-binding protein